MRRAEPKIVQRAARYFLPCALIAAVFCATPHRAHGQQAADHAGWKEYIFPVDGFAVTLPHEVHSHQDANVPDATAYTMDLPDGSGGVMTLRVMHDTRDCATLLGQLKQGVVSGKTPGSLPLSLKDLPLSGGGGLQYEWLPGGATIVLERYLCVNGRFYVFAVSRPRTQALPESAQRIMDSFRITKTNLGSTP